MKYLMILFLVAGLNMCGKAHAQSADVTNISIATVSYINNPTIYIDQVGDSNNINIQQKGVNSIGGVGQQSMPIQGQGNTVKIRQGDPTNAVGQSSVEAAVYGDYNYLGLNQGITLGNQTNGQDTGQHYQSVSISGIGNQINTEQTNTGAGAHYLSTSVTGNYNTITASQTDNTAKSAAISVNGDLNNVLTSQSGTGAHSLAVNLLGNNNSATVNQSGSTANNANISITNAGGPGSVNLTQTGGQNYYINTVCVQAGGCTPITVRQGN
jgi:hypothetical protein